MIPPFPEALARLVKQYLDADFDPAELQADLSAEADGLNDYLNED